jgi:predicted DsbA family dithiol-disulfide isomerase
MTSRPDKELRIQVVFDIVCPWCFIGKRSLDQALAILAEQGTAVTVEWLPYQLNPTLPAEGMDRKTFRSARFGSWENAQAMDARAVAAGRGVGADFQYGRQSRTSNTLAGHSLVRQALLDGGPALQARVVEALFTAYFTNGEDIGDAAVLKRIAATAGLAPDAFDRSKSLRAEVGALDEHLRSSGLNGVPSCLVDGKLLFSGSQDVDGYVQRLSAAARPVALA